MFSTETVIHIAIEIFVIIALYYFLSSRATRVRDELEARIEELEARLALLEQHCVERKPAFDDGHKPAFDSDSKYKPEFVSDHKRPVFDSEPEIVVEHEPTSDHASIPIIASFFGGNLQSRAAQAEEDPPTLEEVEDTEEDNVPDATAIPTFTNVDISEF